jgi:hypothetical protein
MYTPSLNRASRLIWAVLGGAMMAAGVRRRSLWDAACGIGGCGMLLWAFAAPAIPETPERDIVDIWSEDSFPASDPPASW